MPLSTGTHLPLLDLLLARCRENRSRGESLDFQPQRLRLWGWLPFGPRQTAQGLNINRLRLRCLSLPLEACLGPVTTSLLAGLL
jgi:hypothetical protein